MVDEFSAVVQAQVFAGQHLGCLDCGETIYNPICPKCITKQFKAWIMKYPLLARKTLPELKKFLGVHKMNHGQSQVCIICGGKSAYLCPFCFSEYLLSLLKAMGAGEEVVKEFLFLFNYDFGDFEGKWGSWGA